MSVYVGSLKYSPIFKSHCCAFGKKCEERGFDVKYIFSNNYGWMLPKNIKKKTTFIDNSESIPSIINLIIEEAKLYGKKNPNN